MNISAAIETAAERLSESGVAQPRREAASLLTFVLKREAVFLIAHPEYELTPDEAAGYQAALERRAEREPFQYITGRQEFYGLEFAVSPDVLIPRPETEILVEAAIRIVSSLKNPRICEIGVGSGCISVSILHAAPHAVGIGIDISEAALAIARANADRHNVAGRLTLLHGDLFAGAADAFDLVVSNPPYVPDEQIDALQAEVRSFEPRTALSGGPGGLGVIERIVNEAPGNLTAEGVLLMEIGFDQSERVARLFDTGKWASVELLPDLQGIPRIVNAAVRHP